MMRLARRITETSEALQMVTNACEVLTNPCELLTKLTITYQSSAEFLVNPLRMLRILTNALANFANACERLTNETNTQRMHGETPCQCYVVSLLFARLS